VHDSRLLMLCRNDWDSVGYGSAVKTGTWQDLDRQCRQENSLDELVQGAVAQTDTCMQ
jgi:hypothetical protein